MKTVDFSETIAASDLKGSRSRHLIRRYVSIEGQGHFLTLAQGRVHIRGMIQNNVDFYYHFYTVQFIVNKITRTQIGICPAYPYKISAKNINF